MTTPGDRFSALERLMIGDPRLTSAEVAENAGVTLEQAQQLWRAIGFPAAPEDEVLFTDFDAEMLRSAYELVDEGVVEDVGELLQLARAIGQSQARVAESQVGAVAHRTRALAEEQELPREEVAGAILEMAVGLLPRVERYVLYGWRRHLVNAVARELALLGEADDEAPLSVGFADLVGFTAFSQEVDEARLGEVVDRFESTAYDCVASRGGRVVKMIGDEVFFSVDDPVAAAGIGIDLADAYRADPDVPDVRVGLASGPVLARAGDLLGPPVNLASRLVNIARPGAVLASEQVAEAVEAAGAMRITAKPLRRVRSLKGMGRVPVYVLRRGD